MKWRGTSTDTAEQGADARLLRDKLTDIKAGIAQYVRPENQAVNLQTVAELEQQGVAAQALKVGDQAPSFVLSDQNGRQASSAALLAQGPLIVNFFRGRWCPFCVAELESWRDALPQVQSAGASLIAISAQTVKHNAFTADQHKLRFPLLSDAGNQVARGFGVSYRVPDAQRDLYRAVFVNLQLLHGDDSGELPLPATFVITQDGAVAYAFAAADYTQRAEPS